MWEGGDRVGRLEEGEWISESGGVQVRGKVKRWLMEMSTAWYGLDDVGWGTGDPGWDDPRPKNPTQIKFAQEVIGTFLYYARAVDNTMLAPIGAIASTPALSTSSWIDIKQAIDQQKFLCYAITHPDARIQYKPSKMHLWIHTDSSYLNEPKARSRCKIPAAVATSTFLTCLNYPLNPLIHHHL